MSPRSSLHGQLGSVVCHSSFTPYHFFLFGAHNSSLAHLTWYQDHLDVIRTHAHTSKVSLTLHVTREGISGTESPTIGQDLEESFLDDDGEKALSSDAEKPVPTTTHDAHPAKLGRPEISELISTSVARARPEQRVLVVACGPLTLMRDVRRAVGASLSPSGPGIELHCEQFGW